MGDRKAKYREVFRHLNTALEALEKALRLVEAYADVEEEEEVRRFLLVWKGMLMNVTAALWGMKKWAEDHVLGYI